MTDRTQQRLNYIDWMRGLACVLMFQTHGYDSWLGGPARDTHFLKLSQLGGTLPAPLFLFLSGISFALVTDRMRQKGTSADKIARTTILRGAEIFALGLLFRLQEFLLGQPSAPWTDLLRVDILNIISLSLMLMGAICRVSAIGALPSAGDAPASDRAVRGLRARSVIAAVLAAAAIALVTPPLWTTHRPRWLPWYLESYVNGVHIFDKPQPWLFPMFPWAAFAFAGLAIGFLLLSPWSRRHELSAIVCVGAGGVALYALGLWLDSRPVQVYAVYDFWHSSPNFLLARVGIVMGIVLLSYAWCRWGAGQWGFSPLIELGKSSLLVYWVHIEFVYGGLSILKRRAQSIPSATVGVLVIFVTMTILATIRNRTKGRGLDAFAFWRRPLRPANS